MPLTSKAKAHLEALVDEVVAEFAEEIDPNEERYTSPESLDELRADLEEVLDGRIGDWEIDQRWAHGKGRGT
jgi:hypothetical protein